MDDDPHRRVTAFAERLARGCATALGRHVVAVILHGSLTLGDFTPGKSDLDLLIVVERPLADEEIDALLGTIHSLRGEAPSRVDLRVVTRAVAAFPTPAPAMEVYVALQPGRPMEVETRVAGEPDLVVEFSVVRDHGRTLVGAEPSALIGRVPDEWAIEVGDRQLAAWERLVDDAAHAELMVLTTCRIWRFNAERVHCSKAAAGRWALARDPSLSAVEATLRQRGGDPDVTIGAEDIRRLIAIVRREIANG
jgi:predicted nucleotidyltransferase